jgi:flavorubredoxin
MLTILIIYNTRTGNTEKMAKAVEEGAKTIQDINVITSYHAKPEDLQNADAIIIGTPTYNHQPTIDIQVLLQKTVQNNIILKNKPVATFGSYGWSGEAPQQTLETLKNRLQAKTIEPPVLANYTPDEITIQQCRELGKKVAQALLQTQAMRRE